MPPPPDFRQVPHALPAVRDCGRYNGRTSYWRLFAIENILRVIAHTVLISQYQRDWVPSVVSKQKYADIEWRKADYRNHPAGSTPGQHDVYYLALSDLTKIIANHADLFRVSIPDIDTWILRLERVRLPRNIVAHMNWPNTSDRTEIAGLYRQLLSLHRLLNTEGFHFQVP